LLQCFLWQFFALLQPENYDLHEKKGPNSPAFDLKKEKKTHILQQVPEGSQNIKGFLIYWAFISGLEPNLAKYSC